MDLRQRTMPPPTQTLGWPVLNPDGAPLGTVHAVVNDAVPGCEPYLVIAHADRDGGHRFSGFFVKEFECRRHGLGDFLVLRVFGETLSSLPGIDPGLLVRDDPAGATESRIPAARRAVPATA